MQCVYLLWHTHEFDTGEKDVKLLGVYSTDSMARSKIDVYKVLPGFKDSPAGFEVSNYEIDYDEWMEGFVTIPAEDDDI